MRGECRGCPSALVLFYCLRYGRMNRKILRSGHENGHDKNGRPINKGKRGKREWVRVPLSAVFKKSHNHGETASLLNSRYFMSETKIP